MLVAFPKGQCNGLREGLQSPVFIVDERGEIGLPINSTGRLSLRLSCDYLARFVSRNISSTHDEFNVQAL